MRYNENAFTATEDRATPGSDPSAGSGFCEGENPERKKFVALWKTKAINPFFRQLFREVPQTVSSALYSNNVDWFKESLAAGFNLISRRISL